MYFINSSLGYYEGDRISEDDSEVPQRPDQNYIWQDGKWVLDQSAVFANNRLLRQAAYAAEADPLFFEAQRGEATMEEWKAKIEEIKQRYPTS